MNRKLLFGLLLSGGACFGQDICKALLSQDIFDTRSTTLATANRDRLRSIYCRAEASTRSGAKGIEASAGYDGANLGYGQTESEYNDWHSSLCTDTDVESSSDTYSSEQVKQASQAILNTFNNCINRTGLTEYAEHSGDDPYNFFWKLKYVHPPRTREEIPVILSTMPHSVCLLNNAPLPRSVQVGSAGINIFCTRNPCKTITLTANSSYAEVFPSTLTVRRTTAVLQVSKYKTVAVKTFDMKAPFTISLPPDQECTETHEGSWHSHCPNQAVVLLCPGLSIGNGIATAGDFDHDHYDDNCGSCTYTIACRAPTPPHDKSV